MTAQWKAELESKFGLTFDIVDRERIHELRRLRGFSVNPWTTGSRFILSHSLLADEDYVAGLRDPIFLLPVILDEAHHAAPSGGHNGGHSNSFSALLEMLDPQRFTRGGAYRRRFSRAAASLLPYCWGRRRRPDLSRYQSWRCFR